MRIPNAAGVARAVRGALGHEAVGAVADLVFEAEERGAGLDDEEVAAHAAEGERVGLAAVEGGGGGAAGVAEGARAAGADRAELDRGAGEWGGGAEAHAAFDADLGGEAGQAVLDHDGGFAPNGMSLVRFRAWPSFPQPSCSRAVDNFVWTLFRGFEVGSPARWRASDNPQWWSVSCPFDDSAGSARVGVPVKEIGGATRVAAPNDAPFW